MAIASLGPASGAAPSGAPESGKPSFRNTFAEASLKKVWGDGAAHRPGAAAPSDSQPIKSVESSQQVRSVSTGSHAALRVVDQVQAAQARLDRVLRLAETGRTFTPAELLAFQAQVYRASQELDLAGKVVEKITSGVKQVLQTQV